MIPRAGGSVKSRATDSAAAGCTTVAAVGAVRPQPVSSSMRADTEPEQHDQGDAEELQDAVADDDLLRWSARAGLEQQRVAEDAEHHGNDGELVPGDAAGAVLLLERPQAVGGDGQR